MRRDWREEAACRNANPDLFTLADTEGNGRPPNPEMVRRALEFCSECPVVDECREFADSRTDVLITGVWGAEYRSRRLAEQRQQLHGKGTLSYVH